jgi:hypothetical protein
MATAANTDIEVCSRALILIGAEPITSFSDQTTEALVASNIYEDIARASLTNTRWRFATNQIVLNRLSEAPTGRFDSAYQLPSGILMLNAITVGDIPITYDTYGNKVFCDASIADELVADFIFRALEVDWPSYFTLAVEFELASIFAVSIARDPSLGRAMAERAQITMIRARTTDAQQQTTRKLNTSRFISQRRS